MSIILFRLNTAEIRNNLLQFDLNIAVAMLLMNFLGLLLFARRWQWIAAGLNIIIPFSHLLRSIWLAAFFGQFGPTMIASEITRYQLVRNYADSRTIIVSQVLDRASGQIVLFLMIVLLLPVYYWLGIVPEGNKFVSLYAGLFVFLLIVIPLYRKYKNWFPADSKIFMQIQRVLKSPGHYCLSLLIQFLLVINFCMAAQGFGYLENTLLFIILLPLVFGAITLLPITVADWGTRETTALIFLAPTGLSAESIVSISIVYGIFTLLISLAGGFLLLDRSLQRRKS